MTTTLGRLLDGKKSYLGFVGLGILGLVTDAGWIDGPTSDAVYHVLVALTGIGISHKLAKMQR